MKRWIAIIMAAAFAAIFLYSGLMLRQHHVEQTETAEAFSSVADLVLKEPEEHVTESIPVAEETAAPMTAREKYAEVYAVNSDFVGWISIEGTAIDYPVMQSVDRPNYYLRRGFDKEYSKHGVPYVQEDCVVGSSDNLIIYGHHMNDGSMFADLCKYKNKDFWQTHPTIQFDTMEEFGVYEIVAVFKTVVYSQNGFRYFDYVELNDPARFDAYIAWCKAMSLYDTGVTASFGDRFITLSTCVYHVTNGRFVVVAKEVEPGDSYLPVRE